MAKQTTKTAATVTTPPQVDIDALVQTNGENLKAFMEANQAVMDSLAAFSREVMEFSNARLNHDLKTSESLMQCKGADDAFRVQCNFAREATQQYLDEATRLMNLTAKLTQECWAPLRNRAREALKDLDGGNK